MPYSFRLSSLRFLRVTLPGEAGDLSIDLCSLSTAFSSSLPARGEPGANLQGKETLLEPSSSCTPHTVRLERPKVLQALLSRTHQRLPACGACREEIYERF